MSKTDQTDKGLLEKARKFCAFQERCSHEVRRKLRTLGADQDQIEKVLSLLNREGYLDDRRFAEAYAYGKFSNSHWGRYRIRQELLTRNIQENIIQQALRQIDDASYKKTLNKLIQQKRQQLLERNADHIRERTARYCQQKGYEPEVFWPLVEQLIA